MWNIFKKLDGLGPGRHMEMQSIGEAVFYAAMDRLQGEVLPEDGLEARARVVEILYLAECEVYEKTLTEISGRFGRLWYDFLARHDMLPPDTQLSPSALLIARSLVSAFAQGSSKTRRLAGDVLQLMDDAFQNGNLALCEVLLELFDAEQDTRRHNERNVFFDRYTRRLFHARKRLLSPQEIGRLRGLVGAHDSLQNTHDIYMWLYNAAGVRFAVHQEDIEMRRRYDALTAPQQRALRSTLRVPIPYERFRLIDKNADIEAINASVIEHVLARPPHAYMIESIKAAYFIALSTGKNESDEILFEMDPWLQNTIGVDTATILTRVHTGMRKENMLLQDAVELALTEKASSWMVSAQLDREHVTHIVTQLPGLMRQTDVQILPEGLYDLETFVGQLAINKPIRWRLRLCRFI